MNPSPYPFLDDERARTHRLRNWLHSILIMGGLGGLMALGAWLLWGGTGVLISFFILLLVFWFGPRLSAELVMRLFKAKKIDPRHGGALRAVVVELAKRAELPVMPDLYIVPSQTLNAFAVGRPEKSSLALTSALLNTLPDREIIGILAHEISHIRNNDLWIMGLADMMTRFTQTLSTIGLVFLIYNGIGLLMGMPPALPWLVALILYMLPLASSLLQLALSRAREYDADLEAVELTGDPDALASALARLERHQGQIWEDMLPSGRQIPVPSVLRTHPLSQDRINRLAELKIKTRPSPPGHERDGTRLTRHLRPISEDAGRTFPGIRL